MPGDELFETIPNEILESIFELITSPKDLKSLCLVSKRFDALARGMLWREPNLSFRRVLNVKQFTLGDFKWISKMPIQILDISGLAHFLCDLLIGHISELDELDADSWIDLFKMINQMDHLSHLKLDLIFICAREQLWSKELDRCQIKTLTLHTRLYKGGHESVFGIMDLIQFSWKHLPHFKYLESLTLEEELVDPEGYGDYEVPLPSPEAYKLKYLSIKIGSNKPNKYSGLFQILGFFSGLKTLQLQLIVDAWDFNERPFLKAKREFMTSHPQCQVCTEIIMDDSSDSNDDDDGHHSGNECDLPWDFDHYNSDYEPPDYNDVDDDTDADDDYF